MANSLFLFSETGLTQLAESDYDDEPDLQKVVADYPELVVSAVDNIADLLLIKKEAPVPGGENDGSTFRLDHLFIDNDCVPTLVEVKQISDTRIRREVIGQVIDYAAHASPYWSIDTVKAMFSDTCQSANISPDDVLQKFLTDGRTSDEFWQDVKTNLQAGRIRLVFLADKIPERLKRVVEFLNDQMDPCEVIAVEIRQYKSETGQRMVAPQQVGQSASSEQRKNPTSKRRWNQDDFIKELNKKVPELEFSAAMKIIKWCNDHGFDTYWGGNNDNGSYNTWLNVNGHNHQPLAIWSDGGCLIQFHYLKRYDPFSTEEVRIHLLNMLNDAARLGFTPDRINGVGKFKLSQISDPVILDKFLTVMDWFYQTATISIDSEDLKGDNV